MLDPLDGAQLLKTKKARFQINLKHSNDFYSSRKETYTLKLNIKQRPRFVYGVSQKSSNFH